MRKTGESYSSARRYFHTEDNEMTNETTTELQPNLWPDWVDEHPWLVSFLTKAETEARNRGDTCCNHFHMELAFLSLGPPVSDWLGTLGLDARTLREDTVDILGRNAKQALGVAGLEADLARGQRARGARESSNPVDEFPLASVDEVYTGELLELARAEANLHGDSIDERHFLIAMAMLLFEGSPPAASVAEHQAHPAGRLENQSVPPDVLVPLVQLLPRLVPAVTVGPVIPHPLVVLLVADRVVVAGEDGEREAPISARRTLAAGAAASAGLMPLRFARP